jgi:glycosyltransferase involved in cell wall biosynthesis
VAVRREPPLRLGVDGRELRPGVRTGIGRYLLEILRAASREGWPCVIYGDIETHLDETLPGVTFTALNALGTQWWDQVTLPRALARDRITVFLSPYYKCPLRAPCPVVLTIHDLYFIKYPGLHRPMYEAIVTRAARLYAGRAAAIISDSEYSKHAIVERLGVSAAKVNVIPVALGSEFRPASLTAAARARYGLTSPYVLYVGNFNPHKNIPRLIRAFGRLPGHVRSRHSLVLAGGYGEGRPELARLADSLGLTDRVIFSGRIDDADLPALYSDAAVYVTPSLEEGFGATVLEAMACAAPVITSKRAALPEVVGDAGLLFNPEQEEELASVLSRVLSDSALADDLRRRSLARAGLYTPARTTGRVLALLHDVSDGALAAARAPARTR